MIMSKRLYVAYGSNLNFKQMKHRCPTAKLYGIGTVYGYELHQRFPGICLCYHHAERRCIGAGGSVENPTEGRNLLGSL